MITNAAAETEQLVEGFRRSFEGEPGDAYDYRKDFWLTKPAYSVELAAIVCERFQKHVELWKGGSPTANASWLAYRMYHGLARDESSDTPIISLTEVGPNGEFLSLSVNELRGLVRHQTALVTSNRLAWEPQARTSGAEASRQVAFTRNLLDYYMDARGVGQVLHNQLECERIVTTGYTIAGWDANAGRNGRGDLWVQEFAPWEVWHERVRKYTDCKVWIARRLESRWDWIAKLSIAARDPNTAPEDRARLSEKAERLKGVTPESGWFTAIDERPDSSSEDDDRIPVLYLLASPSIACPDGRHAIYAGPDLVLQDGPLPYDSAPVVRMCSAEFIGTSRGIADIWSQLAVQESLTGVLGAIVTRIDQGAVPDIAVPEGSTYEPGGLGGNNLHKFPEGQSQPRHIELLNIPAALPQVAEMLVAYMEKGTGINSVTRGAPTENITSGSMAALVQAMAVQFNSATERAYTQAAEELGTIIIKILQRHATEEQLVSIAGADQLYTAQSFKAEDLNQISRVSIKVGSPLMKTTGGKLELAKMMLEQKVIQDPREFLEVAETGNLTPLFKGPVDQLRIIREENEAMRRGEQVHVEMTDDPYLHIREHGCELDTKARYDAPYADRLRKHCDEHYALLLKTSREDPDRCVAYGYQPLPGASALSAQAAQIRGMGQGPPPQPAAKPRELPNTEEPRKKPGPEPKPPGEEPSTAAPAMPAPAEPPKETV
ncbi:MAG TPA: hypothetical protein VED01_21385 [Burkholderiales bacterium]|nr:hypothetical protein [Burkholderiales bacterium]